MPFSKVISLIVIFIILATLHVTECEVTLTILHTGDMRSNYFASNGRLGSCEYDEIKNKNGICYGSLARRGVFIEETRNTFENVLLVDSGDMEAGGINLESTKGSFVHEMYDLLQYDFVNLGPRDFDDGEDTIGNLTKPAHYKVLGSTFTIDPESEWNGKIHKVGIKEFSGVKVGVIAAASERHLEEGNLIKGITFNSEEMALELSRAVTELAYNDVKIIILLSKSTNPSVDEYYIKKIPEIDIVIGSYKGFYFYNGDPEDAPFSTVNGTYPQIVHTSLGQSYIVAAPSYGTGIGRLVVNFDKDGLIIEYNPGASNSYFLDDDYAVTDPGLGMDVFNEGQDTYDFIDEIGSEVIGKSLHTIVGEQAICRSRECEGGNLVADSIRALTGTQIALINGGAIRATIEAGDVTRKDAINMFPFKNTIATFDISGEGLVEILCHGLSGLLEKEETAAFLHVSGLRFTWNPNNLVNETVTSAEVFDPSSGEYKKILRKELYSVSTADFLYHGGDGFKFRELSENEILGGQDILNTVIRYITNTGTLNITVEGRILQNDEKYIFQETTKVARIDYQIPVAIVTFILICVPIAVSVILYIKRTHAVVVIASPFFCHLITLGAVLSYLALIFHVFIRQSAGCMLIVWFGSIGFSVMYGCLFAKTWRIHSIFSRQKKMKITKKPINNVQLFTILGIMVAIDVVLLSIWQGVSPLVNTVEPTEDNLIFIETCESKNGIYFFIALLVYKALLLVWGMYLVFLTRHVDSDFRESTFIGFIIYAVFLTLAIVIIVGFVIKNNEVVVFFLTCLGFWLITTATILALFIPKLVEIFLQPDLLWESYFKRRAANLSNKSKDGSVIGRKTHSEGHSSYYSVYSSSDDTLKKELKTMKKKDKEKLLQEFENKAKSLKSDLTTTEKQIKLIEKSLLGKKTTDDDD